MRGLTTRDAEAFNEDEKMRGLMDERMRMRMRTTRGAKAYERMRVKDERMTGVLRPFIRRMRVKTATGAERMRMMKLTHRVVRPSSLLSLSSPGTLQNVKYSQRCRHPPIVAITCQPATHRRPTPPAPRRPSHLPSVRLRRRPRRPPTIHPHRPVPLFRVAWPPKLATGRPLLPRPGNM